MPEPALLVGQKRRHHRPQLITTSDHLGRTHPRNHWHPPVDIRRDSTSVHVHPEEPLGGDPALSDIDGMRAALYEYLATWLSQVWRTVKH
jgi:hypothetical protein